MQKTRREFVRQSAQWALLSTAGLSLVDCANDPVAVADAAAPGLEGLDGIGLAELVKAGEVTPLELVEAALARVDAVNPQINAVLTELFDVEKARARAGSELGDSPLSGVPVMIKNLIGYSEAKITSGSRLFELMAEVQTDPQQTSPVIAAMEEAGMIVTGITSSPELGLIDTTEPVLYGPTRNPWNLDRTAGGSSGGSAAAVAAGIVPIGHANDGGGSIRLPASQCGLVGLKPSRGREAGSGVSRRGAGILDISSDLCVTRSVRDTAAFLSLVEKGDDPDQPAVGYVTGPSTDRRKIALLTSAFDGSAPDNEVLAGVEATAALCEELGHEVHPIDLPISGPEFVDTFIGFWSTGTVPLEQLAAQIAPGTPLEELVEPWTIGLINVAKERGPEACVARAEAVFAEANAAMEALFADYDAMLSPVLRKPPYAIGDHDPRVEFDELMERVLDKVGYTPLQNATGMPGISLPLHWTSDGLPVGMQLSAWRGGERTLLEMAYELEEGRPWKDKRPPVWAS